MLGQFLRFAAVGAVATAAQYAVLIALVQLWGAGVLRGRGGELRAEPAFHL
jgi:putative flippase GtrA